MQCRVGLRPLPLLPLPSLRLGWPVSLHQCTIAWLAGTIRNHSQLSLVYDLSLARFFSRIVHHHKFVPTLVCVLSPLSTSQPLSSATLSHIGQREVRWLRRGVQVVPQVRTPIVGLQIGSSIIFHSALQVPPSRIVLSSPRLVRATQTPHSLLIEALG